MKPYTGHVTPEMQKWAVGIDNDPTVFPMGAETRHMFGDREFLARVEPHTWTMIKGVKVYGHYRGVTLYDVTPEAPAPEESEG